MFSSNTSQVSGGYEIQRSLRFNSADSAYLNRTPASASNRRTWTWSAWVKRGRIGNVSTVFSTRGDVTDAQYFRMGFGIANADTFYVSSFNSTTIGLETTALFRDPSAWYHIVFAFDTTQATASNRMKLYVNGVQQTAFGTANYPSQNFEAGVNTTVEHAIGRILFLSNTDLDGYLTEVNFIDGQALTPSSFGAFDAQTGVWGPTPYGGSYGTNGFYLNFSDNSNTTAATLGRDYSGNGNNWTPNNFSVSAGAGNDSLVDVPTNWGTDTGVGGSVRGNYCTWNPLKRGTGGSGLTLSNGNLEAVTPTDAITSVGGTIGVATGKWYWEVTAAAGSTYMIGIGNEAMPTNTYPGGASGWGYYTDGQKYLSDIGTAYGASYTTGDIVGVALDMDAGTLTFYKNGVSQGQAFSGITGTIFPVVGDGGTVASASFVGNFGQRPFAYTAPSGFKALNTQNLPLGTITTSGTFIGNGSADGPFVYLNGVPTAMTINGNAVTFATHADKLSNGFKVRTTSSSYNNNGASNTYSITTTGDKFKNALAQVNP